MGMSVVLYVLGVIHLFLGIFSADTIEKARSYGFGAAMFGAAACVGLWAVMRKAP